VPVVNISYSRFKKFLPGVPVEKILEILPYAGLDIEGADGDTIRLEYNPNRPDFSSDYGIFRALRGIMGIETGMPKFKLGRTNLSVVVDSQTRTTRPHIVALVAKGGTLDNTTIKQLITMQEDLHDGIGRRRKKASIGLHNLDSIRFPVSYTVADPKFSFVPLGESSPTTIRQVLEETATGRQFGRILGHVDRYPVIVDKSGSLLSLPPIINGDVTKVDEKTRNLFVEVTATGRQVADDVLAIIAVTLRDAGFDVSSVDIRNGGKTFKSPEMGTTSISVDVTYVNSVLGLNLDARQITSCLKKSRLGALAKGSRIICEIPRYRTDISHPIDIAEEVAIGFGIYNLEPTLPASSSAGTRSAESKYINAIREVLAGLGMLESLNFSLTSFDTEYGLFDKSALDPLGVEGPKSAEHEFLRDSLIPSLLQSLSRNVHEEYPQKLFEIGKVFHGGSAIRENWAIAAVTAHENASYTEIKSYMQALLNSGFGMSCNTASASSPFFIPGRSANIMVDGGVVGSIGEVIPLALEKLKMRVPVSAFEIDLGTLLHLPQ
jgi:phenylalanyl-tRNA synthetase beta chain